MMTEFEQRALAAYYWRGGMERPTPHTRTVRSQFRGRLVDLNYVVLKGAKEGVIVFRITNQGSLKRLRRLPKELQGGGTNGSGQ